MSDLNAEEGHARVTRWYGDGQRTRKTPVLGHGGFGDRRAYAVVNCSSSVEPVRAVVEAVPPEMTMATSSK